MDKIKILIVDDEPLIVDVIKSYLEKEGFETVTAYDGNTALKLFNDNAFHLVILDLMLPYISGEELCIKIRASSSIPIIMLTAKADEENKLDGFALGADDYVTKPFSTRELVGRVKALLRRTYRDENTLADYLIFNDGDLKVDINKMKVFKKGSEIILTPYEFKVLKALLTNPGQVFSREQLVLKAFGFDYDSFDRTIDSYIKNIRQKIEEDVKTPQYILTVYGVGYKFGGVA